MLKTGVAAGKWFGLRTQDLGTSLSPQQNPFFSSLLFPAETGGMCLASLELELSSSLACLIPLSTPSCHPEGEACWCMGFCRRNLPIPLPKMCSCILLLGKYLLKVWKSLTTCKEHTVFYLQDEVSFCLGLVFLKGGNHFHKHQIRSRKHPQDNEKLIEAISGFCHWLLPPPPGWSCELHSMGFLGKLL